MSANTPIALDSVQEKIAGYASGLSYEQLPAEAVHAAKVCLIDTLGVALGGFFGEPCRVARNLAAQMSSTSGATVLGTRISTTPDMAAYVNGIAARYLEYNDVYHFPGSAHGHPSDLIPAALAAGEHAHVSGRDLITGIVIGYDVYGHVSDRFKNMAFDNSNFCTAAASVAAGKILGLTKHQLAQCMGMAVVPNNILRQVRRDRFGMWKEIASGHAARAAVFAAMLAREDMEGPYLPFEGEAGWCKHVLGNTFDFENLGKDFKILHARTRHRPAMGETHASIFAAESLGPLKPLDDVQSVKIETYKRARDLVGIGHHFFNPETRETADHSLPYVVAAALMDGEVTRRSFNDDRLWSPALRGLLQKIEVVENEEFTAAYNRVPREQRARITVVMKSGETRVGEAGGGSHDLAAAKSDAEIVEKFRGLTEEFFGAKRVDAMLDRFWNLERIDDVAAIPSWLVFA